MTFGAVTRDIRNPWYDPSYANLYEWMNRIRMPDGSSPAIHDSPIGFGTSIASLSGNSRFNIPNPPYPPTDVMWRTQYIATNVGEGSFSDTLFRALPEAGSLVFRSSNEPDAVFMHFIGKHGIPLSGAKAHHQGDAGSFSLMANGELLAVDPGYPGYQESYAVNTASNHSLTLVNGSGPLPPIGELVNVETNTCWIEHFFDTPQLDYGEVRTAYFGADIIRKNLFIRDRYFILADFLTSSNPNTYTFQLQGNGLFGGAAGTPEGAFVPDFANHQGTYSRDSTHLLVHTIATGGATNYAYALDSLATGTSQYRHYSKMLVRKDSVVNTGFLSVLFPFTNTQPDVSTLAAAPAVNAIRVTDGNFDDLAFSQQDTGLLFIPASVSGLTGNVSGNGTINQVGFRYGSARTFFLENGDSIMVGLQLYIKADHRIDVAYEQTNALLHQGYVSDAGWVGFQTANLAHFIPTSGNILDFGYDYYNGLLLVLFGGPSYFTLEYSTGSACQNEGNQKPDLRIRSTGNSTYELIFQNDHATMGILSVHSISGQNLSTDRISIHPGLNHLPLDLSGAADGLYLITVTTSTGNKTVKALLQCQE
ncbi:MAG: heparinase II/III family protein [Bacteroidota bacterium]